MTGNIILQRQGPEVSHTNMHSQLGFCALAQLLPALLIHPISSSAHPLETSPASSLESRQFTFCNDEEWIQSYYFNTPLVGKFPRLPAKDKVYVRYDQGGLHDDELKRDLEGTPVETGLSVRQPVPVFNCRRWEAKGEYHGITGGGQRAI